MRNKYLDNFFSYYSKLNKEQKLAVDSIEGPVLVIAGPGTGKTQVLTIRIANILRLTDINPDSILCLTFQESSVFAMRERLKLFLGDIAYKIGVYTFHSFCCEIIRNFYYLFDFSADLEPISDLEKIEIFKEIIEKNNLVYLQTKGDVLGHFKEIASKVSALKKEFITPNTLYNKIEELKNSDVLTDISENNLNRLNDFYIFYREYIRILQDKNLIDFDDMIFRVTDAFTKHEDLVKFFQEKYLYTLVDEFQDTNSAQLEIVKTVGSFEGLDANIFVVGDDDQTIFRFQGASTDNFKKFIDIFPNSKIIILHTNYRSDQEIIDFSSNLIVNNENRLVNSELLIRNNLKKEFKSINSSLNDSVQLHIFDHYWLEDYWITNEIKKLVDQGLCSYSDIAVIGRTNRQLLNLTKFFDKLGIPYAFKKTESVLNDIYIRRLIFLFEALADPNKLNDDIYLWEVLSIDFLKLSPTDVLMLYTEAKERKISLFKFITQNHLLTDSFLKINNVLSKLIEYESYAVSEPFTKVFLKFINDFELLRFFKSLPDSVNLIRKLSSLYQYINSRVRFLKEYTIKDFIREIKIMQDRDIDILIDDLGDNTGNRVNVITAHSSKGLEFNVVFIYQCIENKWEKVRGRGDVIKLPLILESGFNQSSIEKLLNEWDERRLFYVSITRAKKKLYLTYSKKYFETDDGGLDETEKMPSRFISEMKIPSHKMFYHPELLGHIDKVRSLMLGIDNESNFEIDEFNDDYKSQLMNLIKNKLNLSYTSLVKYQKCRYKFLLEDVFQVPLQTSVYQLFGIYVHKGINYMYQRVSEFGFIDNENFFQILTELEKELINEYNLRPILEKDASLDKLVNDFKKALKIYFNYLVKKIQENDLIEVIESEKTFKGMFNGTIIQGRIDLISNQKGTVTITDFKTVSKVPSINEFLGLTKNKDLTYLKQLLFYNILVESSTNYFKLLPKKVDKLRIEFIDLSNEEVDVKEIPANGIFYYKERKNSKNLSEFDVSAVINILKDEILDVKKGIESLSFQRTSDLKNCTSCPFRRHCGR